MQYIDVTPTWTAVIPLLTTGIEQGGTAGELAMIDLYSMARLADRWNACAYDMLAALEAIFEGEGMTGENMDKARAAIAKVRGEVS